MIKLEALREMAEAAKADGGEGPDWQLFWDTITEDDVLRLLDLATAAKAEPLTIDRDALAAVLLVHGHVEWDQFDAETIADVVIAHLALSAQEAATEVEWGVRDDRTGRVTSWGHQNFLERSDSSDYPGYTIVRRDMGPWQEVPADE